MLFQHFFELLFDKKQFRYCVTLVLCYFFNIIITHSILAENLHGFCPKADMFFLKLLSQLASVFGENITQRHNKLNADAMPKIK